MLSKKRKKLKGFFIGGENKPVIDEGFPGTEGIQGGFEGGRVVKVGDTYHMFPTERAGEIGVEYYYDRFKYDKDGDLIRYAFETAFKNVHNGQTFKEHAEYLRAQQRHAERCKRMEETKKHRVEGNGECVCNSHYLFVVSVLTL